MVILLRSAVTTKISSEKSKVASSSSSTSKASSGVARRSVKQREEPQRGLGKRNSTVSSVS